MAEQSHDELLADVLAGDRSAADPALERARRNPVFAARMEKLEALEGRLAAAAAEQRRVVGEARDAGPDPLDAVLERTLGIAPRPRSVRFAPWIVAAGLLLAAGLTFALLGPGDRGEGGADPGPRYLGENTTLSPSGEVPAFSRFTWALERDPAGWFVVEVRGLEGNLLARSPKLESAGWTVPDDQARGWPNDIRWEVLSCSPIGTPVESARAEARRRP